MQRIGRFRKLDVAATNKNGFFEEGCWQVVSQKNHQQGIQSSDLSVITPTISSGTSGIPRARWVRVEEEGFMGAGGIYHFTLREGPGIKFIIREGRMKILEMNGITKHFGNITALKEVSFAIEEGEIFGVIGPNGAGKTTLVNVITGMVPYSKGDILFLGKSIRDLKAYQIGGLGISRTFGLVPPATQMTLLENVMVGALFGCHRRERSEKIARRKAMETLDFLGLVMKKDAPACSLNVLERKRLEIATALAMNPKLLLLDETMSGLNPVEVGQALETINRIREEGVTILLIEHVMKAIVNSSDRVLVLHRGEKIIEGPVDRVLNNGQVIETYLGKRYRDLLVSAQKLPN